MLCLAALVVLDAERRWAREAAIKHQAGEPRNQARGPERVEREGRPVASAATLERDQVVPQVFGASGARASQHGEASDLDVDLPSNLLRRGLSATIRIVNKTRGTEASGVIVGQRGPFAFALTAHHVAQVGDHLEVHTFQSAGAEPSSRVFNEVEVIAQSDETDDVAAIRILTPSERLPALSICPHDSIPAEDGFPALSIGCTPGGEPSVVIHQSVEARRVRRSIRDDIALVWAAADDTQPGRSGGPLVDRHGHVIGIQSGTSAGAGYYCHITAIHRLLADAELDWLLAPELAGSKP